MGNKLDTADITIHCSRPKLQLPQAKPEPYLFRTMQRLGVYTHNQVLNTAPGGYPVLQESQLHSWMLSWLPFCLLPSLQIYHTSL